MKRHWTALLGMALGVAAPLTLTSPASAGDHVTLEQLPAPVRETVLRETQGGRIWELERETDDGQVVYEVEFIPQSGARKVELKIAPDGRILERETKF